ncbi:MAG: hypothetical protein IH587_05500 [Anaerolineae bacterium]|nr:hypothetical protein [Anaerolineae bacterium]
MRHFRWLCFGIPLTLMVLLGHGSGLWLITDDRHTLTSRMTFESTTIVVGGELTLEHDSTLEGDLLMLGGDAAIAGTVTHNLTLLGGSVHLDDHACIGGELRIAGGSLRQGAGPGSQRVIVGLGHSILPTIAFHTGTPLLDLVLGLLQQVILLVIVVFLVADRACCALDSLKERRAA